MPFGAIVVGIPQHPRHPPMSLMHVGIDCERRFVMKFGPSPVILFAQQIGEIDTRNRIVGMMLNRFLVCGAGGRAKTSGKGEVAEFIQRIKIRRIKAQNIDIRLLRGCVLRLCSQRSSAFQLLGDLQVA